MCRPIPGGRKIFFLATGLVCCDREPLPRQHSFVAHAMLGHSRAQGVSCVRQSAVVAPGPTATWEPPPMVQLCHDRKFSVATSNSPTLSRHENMSRHRSSWPIQVLSLGLSKYCHRPRARACRACPRPPVELAAQCRVRA